MFHISKNFPSNDIALDLLTEMTWLCFVVMPAILEEICEFDFESHALI